MLAGGYDKEDRLASVEVLSTVPSFKNKKLAELPYIINGRPSLFLHDDNLLICGGYGNYDKCFMYEKDAWKELSTLKLNEYRSYASTVTTADGTFIFGGYDSRDTYEFLPPNKVWQEGKTKIPNQFYQGCAVEVPNKKEILLVGGRDTFKRILKFDIENEDFKVMNVSLLKGREYHTCARLPDTNLIVITGGRDSDGNEDDTTEILNLEDDSITLGNPMNVKRRDHGMAVITIDDEDRLAVFGGHNGDDSLDSVETLNPRTRKWEVTDLKLDKAKRKFGFTSLPDEFISKL